MTLQHCPARTSLYQRSLMKEMSVVDLEVKQEPKPEAKPGAADASTAPIGLAFSAPLLAAMPDFVGAIARQGASRIQDSCDKLKAASDEIAEVARESYVAGAKGATDYGLKLIEISGASTTSTFDFLSGLLKTRTPADVLELTFAHTRRSLDVASARNVELWSLTGKLATATTEPFRRTVARSLPHAD